jgi:hypothetical protein
MSVCCLTHLLDPYPPLVRTLALDLAALIRDTAPGAVEAVRLNSRCVRYSHSRCGYFCGLYPQVSSVQLLFEFGVLLPDPDGLLRGEGPYVRFVAVRDYQPRHAPALCQLIAAAYNLPLRRAAKIALAEELVSRQPQNTTLAAPGLPNSLSGGLQHAGML